MRALTAAECRELDSRTIAAGTPGIVLMKRAAAAVDREVARVLARRPDLGARVVVLAGPGNNGGDGFETARLLLASRVAQGVETLLAGPPERVVGDAKTMYQRLVQSGGAVREVASEQDFDPLAGATLIVDALFGTGLKRAIAPGSLGARAVDAVGRSRAFVVSVDLPSGLSADEEERWQPSIVADVTVTFGSPKRCHVLLPAAGACGRVVVADIGLLSPSPASAGEPDALCGPDLVPLFPPRPPTSHKGDWGRLVIVGGSAGMAGAPGLAARAALRAGVGLSTVAAPDPVREIVHVLSPETTTVATDFDPAPFDALAVGPGLGTAPAARELLVRMAAAEKPAVFDADALNLAREPEFFSSRRVPTVLTPHPGEAGRLLGIGGSDVNADRIGWARRLASRARAVVVLKGFRSVVADPEGRTALVLAGNPGMASGGAGDVLTGVTGCFLARGLPAFEAAGAAAWLHGTAGDLAREIRGEESLTAGDIVAALPEAFAALREAGRGR